MRAYRKTSIYFSHDFALYLKAEELAALLEECQNVDASLTPHLARVLEALLTVND